MKIRTRVFASAALAFAAIVTCGVLLGIGAYRSFAADAEQEKVQAAARAIAGLLTLTYEYALRPEARAAEQWQQQQADLAATLVVPVQSGESCAARLALRDAAAQLPRLFRQLIESGVPAPGDTGLAGRSRDLLIDQLLARTQTLADVAYRWSREAAAAEQAARRRLRIGGFAAMLLLLVTGLAQPIVVWRRVLRPLSVLERAAAAVEQGDLRARCASSARDELGEVARRFDAMTLALAERSAELERNEAELELLARNDALTGLPNRRQFDERLGEAMARSRRTRAAMGLLFLDIDRFKAINDSLGHAAGDAVLKEVAHRLKASVRSTDRVARLAGDEFVVILDGVRNAAESEQVAQKIVLALRDAFVIDGKALRVTASIGVALFEGDATPATELMARADAALYQAKNAGRDGWSVKRGLRAPAPVD